MNKTNEALKLAKECGATTYTNRHYPDAAAVTFGPLAWEKFCEQAFAAPAPVQEPAKRVCSLGCKNLGYLASAMLLTFGVMAVSWLVVMLVDHLKKPPPSICPDLIAKHQATGLPAHLKIKCKEFLT